MLVKQSKNTFIRTTERYGYVTNQLTRHDRTYDESGADWLKEIKREPQDVDDILVRLVALYEDAMKANRVGYTKVLDYAKKLKVKAQTDYIMMARSDLDTGNLANRLSLEETEELLRDIIEHDILYREETLQQLPITDEIKFNLERFMKQPVCGVGYDNCCITANGDVYPCAGWQDYVLGNVYKQTLKEIWEESERVKELRKITQASFPQCLECEARDYCA